MNSATMARLASLSLSSHQGDLQELLLNFRQQDLFGRVNFGVVIESTKNNDIAFVFQIAKTRDVSYLSWVCYRPHDMNVVGET